MPGLPLIAIVAVNAWFVPMHLAAFACQDRLLTPRNARALWMVRLATLGLVLVLDDRLINPSSIVSIALTGVFMPLVFFRDPLRERMFVAALVVTVAAFAELIGTAAWMWVVPGVATSDYLECFQNYPEHVLGMGVALMVECLGLAVMARAWETVRDETRRDDSRSNISLSLALFPVVQAAALLVLASSVMVTPRAHPELLLAASLPCGLCLLAELAVLNASGAMRRSARLKAEALELRETLRAAMVCSHDEARTELDLAHMRHDARGAVQAAVRATASGKQEEAYRILMCAARRLKAEMGGGA